MSSTFQSLVTQSLKTTWQLTAANRHPGYEKNVLRIQGFVFGALFVTIVNLVGEILFPFARPAQDPKALTTAWATAILAAFVYAWIVASIDRNEKEPWHMLLVGLLWGSMVSAAIAGLLNSIADTFIKVPAHVVSPFTEELTKGAVLFLIFRYAADEFDDALDGLIYGAMVGIGFAMTENATYFFRHDPASDINSQMHTFQFLLRVILLGLTGHATYTALIGLGLGLSRQTSRRPLQILFPVLGLLLAILAHALWNNDAVQQLMNDLFKRWNWWEAGPLAARVALVNGPFLIGAMVAVIFSWRKEARVIVEQLADELEPNDPYVAPEMMFTFRGRWRARRQALRTHGIFFWWTLRQLQHAYIELAFCKWRQKDIGEVFQRIERLRERLGI
jgi:RsiW-degrading membrane proteinase PrsW (M82 family)